jgi:tetratricopeptide (TPR) repeat protein
LARKEIFATAAGALLLLAGTPAHGQQALLEEAGRLFEMGERADLAGNHQVAITNYRAAVEQVERAEASSLGDSMIVNGRREMMLSLGEAYTKARRHDDALALYTRLAEEIGGSARAIPAGRAERLHFARSLRGLVDAGVNARDGHAARAALTQLVATGRAMHADEPGNTYLTRRLAQDLQAEVIFRWVLDDGPGSAAVARETLALFRTLALANPNSAEALQSRFLWAYGAAELSGNDVELWREAVEAGEQLVGRRQMKDEHAVFLRASRDRLGRLDRDGR